MKFTAKYYIVDPEIKNNPVKPKKEVYADEYWMENSEKK
tara:strand:+ start:740 stop:856 length:117 start_codon:yes stop_codon:yes gene_type:complete